LDKKKYELFQKNWLGCAGALQQTGKTVLFPNPHQA
jgi:hypothetical protein